MYSIMILKHIKQYFEERRINQNKTWLRKKGFPEYFINQII